MVSTMRRKLSAVTIRPVGDELLVLDTDAQRIHQLNATASFIWQCCDRAASADEIAGLVATEYAVDQHIALRDVAEILGRLRELNLVVEC
jgi:hypothetical protein